MKHIIPKLLLALLLFAVYACNSAGISAKKRTDPSPGEYHISGLRGQDSIITLLEQELQDTQVRANFSTLTQQIIATLRKSKTDRSVLYPSEPFDKVSLYAHTPPIQNKYKDRKKTHFIKDLTHEQANALFNLLNNPLYYQWGECGTPVEEFKLCFYRKDKRIATVDLCCNLAQITGIPESHVLSRFGGMKDEGVRYLRENVLGTE